ncbi:hypothetical protein BS17DRAFT_812737 [Gyrodon lividus]|nr:hypothetical protein BS17DRAFT_812737 [Gyrodon lividus]
MSALPLVDSFDAQMLDFAHDLDVPMNTAASTEFLVEALMDHDGHSSISTYGEHASVEVDMEEYAGDNAEYEMTDDTTEYHHHRDEPLDVEVYDVSHAPSPLVPHRPLHPSVDVSIESGRPQLSSPTVLEPSALPLDHPVSGIPHVEPVASGDAVPLDLDRGAIASELAPSADAPHECVPPSSEFHEQTTGDVADASEHTFEFPTPTDTYDEANSYVQASAEEHPVELSSSEVTQHENPELSVIESVPLAGAEEVYDGSDPVQKENPVDQVLVTEGETIDPLQISDGVYIDPPPAVLLSIAASSEPEFSLFNQPEAEPGSESTSDEFLEGKPKVYSLLLDSRPTLYYEPLSNVFEALRQDEELLARIPHSFEGELVLDAYDLQLIVSEDNVHSRDLSLHDLNVLHDGSDFAGPLRLHLRACVPRFIVRYYTLQEQVQRLNLATETGEGELYEEGHTEGGEQPQHDQVEEGSHVPAETANTNEPELLEVPPSAEADEPIYQPTHQPTLPPIPREEEVLEETEKAENTSAVPGLIAEYHEIAGEAAHALEDEDGYEGTNAGDEDESVQSESLDADQVHGLAALDSDSGATVTSQESGFGGEQTEYLNYVQLAEYEERYGEDLPEQAGEATDVQYGEAQHYEEGEQDTSTAVDDTQEILPGSDQDEEHEATATPMPAPAILEPDIDELVPGESSGELPSVEQDNSATKKAKSAAGESSSDTIHGTPAEGSRHSSKARVENPPGEDESDSNFIAMLEREADAELDRTFNPSDSGGKGGIEALLENDETWDDWGDADAEGEDDQEYWVDPDAVSNDSSATLSSKASSKRAFEEVDLAEEEYTEELQSSPGSKRPRVE